MKTFIHILTALALSIVLTSCNKDVTPLEDLPVVDLVATHAFDTQMPVSRLTFVPNSMAPWLGRIILLSADGKLYSTDIEGRDPKPVGSGKYIDIFGLARENAPGVFLAITENNGIEAFIETDNDGNFSPMIYSGTNIVAQGFCPNIPPSMNMVMVTTPKNQRVGLDFTITGDNNIAQSVKSPTADQNHETVCKTNITPPFSTQGGILYALDPESFEISHTVNINDGLSVRGLENIKFMSATHFNYGGVFPDGVIAMADATDQRLVLLSLDYVTRKLSDQTEAPAPQ